MGKSIGSVTALWRFPVKSMTGERLSQADCTEQGVLGDRAYALIDTETGKVVSAKSVRLFPELLDCRAAFVEPPRVGRELPPVRITLKHGATATSDDDGIDGFLSTHFKRDVRLAKVAPADFTIDQYYPDMEDLGPAGHRDASVEQKLGSAFFAEVGMPSPVPAGSFFDLFPLSVMTTSTLDCLTKRQAQTRFDERRFRMNVIVATSDAGFVENGWIGQSLAIGNAVRLGVAMPDPRCVMTTLAQDDLANDTNVLRALVQHNRIQVGESGRFPCAGVYAVVGMPGSIRVGDAVALN